MKHESKKIKNIIIIGIEWKLTPNKKKVHKNIRETLRICNFSTRHMVMWTTLIYNGGKKKMGKSDKNKQTRSENAK